jgi:hypothetical protein
VICSDAWLFANIKVHLPTITHQTVNPLSYAFCTLRRKTVEVIKYVFSEDACSKEPDR